MHFCCNDNAVAPSVGAPKTGRSSWLRRVRAVIEWGAPIAALALIPKCPACLAGYVLLFTGVGLSFPTAAATRWALIGLCVLALGYLLVRATRRAIARSVRLNNS